MTQTKVRWRLTLMTNSILEILNFSSLSTRVMSPILYVWIKKALERKGSNIWERGAEGSKEWLTRFTVSFQRKHCGLEQPRIGTYVLGHLFVHSPVCSLALLTHSLAPPYLLRSHTPLRSFIWSLAHSLTPRDSMSQKDLVLSHSRKAIKGYFSPVSVCILGFGPQ